jgi:16S rRNA (guanine527-N7)-methyltransferase
MAGMDQRAVRAQLGAGLEQMGLVLSAEERDRLLGFLDLLHRWNKAYNLTAVRDPGEMVPKHLLDSLSVGPYLFGDTILDLGTGPGLPGIPLAVTAPERAFYLLDSNGKKTRFVRQVAMDLGLKNVTAIQARMESYLPERKFATIISRAVTSVPDLLAAAASSLARPGRLLAMKGLRPDDDELCPLEPSPVTLKIHRLEVPFLVGERHLVDVRYD